MKAYKSFKLETDNISPKRYHSTNDINNVNKETSRYSPLPLSIKYLSLTQWSYIPDSPKTYSNYIQMIQCIILRESILSRLISLCGEMDDTYWQYATLKILENRSTVFNNLHVHVKSKSTHESDITRKSNISSTRASPASNANSPSNSRVDTAHVQKNRHIEKLSSLLAESSESLHNVKNEHEKNQIRKEWKKAIKTKKQYLYELQNEVSQVTQRHRKFFYLTLHRFAS